LTRIIKQYPAHLPDPSTVAPGTVVADTGWGLWGEGQGWRQHTSRFTGPTWHRVLLETPTLRAVRRKITDLVFLLAFLYMGGVIGWTAARTGQRATAFDVQLIAGIGPVMFVCFLVVVWGRASVADPRTAATDGAR
jgi:hypothetical protein